MKNYVLSILITASLAGASAFEIKCDNDVIINKPVNENLYIAGGNVIINAPIRGDLIVAGGNVTVNDSVSNDILVAGGSVTFNGFAGEDLRCAGGKIRISKNVRGDVLVSGGSILIDRDISIGNLLASGGNVTINGNVNGKLSGVFGELFLNGSVGQELDCRGGKLNLNGSVGGSSLLAARTIDIGQNARFQKDVRYWNEQGSLNFKQSLKNGSVARFDPTLKLETDRWYFLGSASLWFLLWYIGMALVMIFIIQYLFSGTMKRAAHTAYTASLRALGAGFLFLIAIPVAAIIAFITLVGIPLGVLLLIFYVTLILLATVITATLIANLINLKYHKEWSYTVLVAIALGLFIFLKLLSLVPFIGWLIILLTICLAFGSIALNIYRRRYEKTTVELAEE